MDVAVGVLHLHGSVFDACHDHEDPTGLVFHIQLQEVGQSDCAPRPPERGECCLAWGNLRDQRALFLCRRNVRVVLHMTCVCRHGLGVDQAEDLEDGYARREMEVASCRGVCARAQIVASKTSVFDNGLAA